MRSKLFNKIYVTCNHGRSLREDLNQLALPSPVYHYFQKELSLIKSPTKQIKVAEVLNAAITRNIIEPASSTGKYHPDFAHNEYGLGRHVKTVVSFAADMCTAFPQLDYDTMVIAALLHDILKYKSDGKFTSKDHANEAADLLESKGLKDEARLVRSHMGKWDAEKGKAPAPKQFDEQCLHLADYLASRTYVHVDFDENDNIIENNNDLIRDHYDEGFRSGYEEGGNRVAAGESLF
jgi:putative nucleotidyltransferase with HDIG domain